MLKAGGAEVAVRRQGEGAPLVFRPTHAVVCSSTLWTMDVGFEPSLWSFDAFFFLSRQSTVVHPWGTEFSINLCTLGAKSASERWRQSFPFGVYLEVLNRRAGGRGGLLSCGLQEDLAMSPVTNVVNFFL